jgi:molybdenum cofactor biosynthesis enzyme MoaA
MITKEKIPALRIAMTTECNLKCEYCPLHGENYGKCGFMISNKELGKELDAARAKGITHYKITGGEPLIDVKKLEFILSKLSKMNCEYVSVTTNGLKLKENIQLLASKKISELKVSLDTLDRNKYKRVCGIDGLREVISGIKSAVANGLNTRINTVVTKDNYRELPDMIKFCQKNKLNIKLLDLNWYADTGKYWDSHYKGLADFVKINSKYTSKKNAYTLGGYGIPMTILDNKGTKIIVKDSSRGAQYSPICKGCSFLPNKTKHYCQEGIYELTLTADGKLKICRHRPDLGISIKGLSQKEMQEKLDYILNNYFPLK